MTPVQRRVPFCQRLVSRLRYLFSNAVATHMVGCTSQLAWGTGRLQRALQFLESGKCEALLFLQHPAKKIPVQLTQTQFSSHATSCKLAGGRRRCAKQLRTCVSHAQNGLHPGTHGAQHDD